MTTILAIILGFVIDLIVGDPYSWPHPIRTIGNMITWGEKKLRKPEKYNSNQLKTYGGLLALGVTLSVFFIASSILAIAYEITFVLGFIVEVIMCYQVLATKCLKVESMKVYEALKENNLQKSREHVAMIVGRDVMQLNEMDIAKATIETVAENTTDGVIAPLFYLLIGGAPLAFWYKAINTLDSMIGYKNDKYLYFGCIAAKLDDIANFVPARIAAILMIVASALNKLDYKQAWAIFKRDRFNHKSPNSAQTESVCAGALNIQLAGNAYYFGKLIEKPTIGDANVPISYEHIRLSNALLYTTAFLGVVIGASIRLLIF